ncbi:MAG: hypothetical protein ACJ71R_23660 [Nitrososphaeraceae archaeon]
MVNPISSCRCSISWVKCPLRTAIGRKGGPRGFREKNLHKIDPINNLQQERKQSTTYIVVARIKI